MSGLARCYRADILNKIQVSFITVTNFVGFTPRLNHQVVRPLAHTWCGRLAYCGAVSRAPDQRRELKGSYDFMSLHLDVDIANVWMSPYTAGGGLGGRGP